MVHLYKISFSLKTKNNYNSSMNIIRILKRINLTIKFIDDIDCNVNIELLLDKFVIELGDYSE